MAAAEQGLLHLDANFLVEVAAGQAAPARQIERWLREYRAIHVSAIAWSEFLCGPLLPWELENAQTVVGAVEQFTEDYAMLAAELFNLTGRRSRSHVDCMIAAHAIRREAVLATRNVQDFRPFTKFGLSLA